MNLGDFNIKNLGKDLLQSKVLSDFVNNFINELKDYLEKGDNKNIMNVNKESKYSNYWDYQNFMEDNVAATIGLSRWSTDISYSNELSKAVDNSILEISEKEGTLYRKQFTANGSAGGEFYNVDKYENGEIIPDIITILEICNCLNINLSQLFPVENNNHSCLFNNPFHTDKLYLYYYTESILITSIMELKHVNNTILISLYNGVKNITQYANETAYYYEGIMVIKQ